MVSLRRRRLLGLCSVGNSSFVTPLPLHCEHLTATEASGQQVQNTIVKDEPGSSNASGSSLSKEDSSQQSLGPPVKRRKQHLRKHAHDKEPCFMRGVYYKNMKWQAAIKVDKKQIHLGTVESQEEAAHLYDRAAFMCGREPNFELQEEEKMELCKLKWEDFLAMTRQAIISKKHKRKHSPEAKDVSMEVSVHSVDRKVVNLNQQTTVSKDLS
ncbi:ethylene-responsive transcription factor-like protein At4g13040 isoform X1 [Vigna umbellata]|uniref:ethylene-responsive transcription factor-like protein At4g13040 isoform X1 n=1 Tax=Vigna umbellata TaxID=87088 RepID=UPI001F5F72C5|nr:ethylene-responsive transcription factor-like protein At4g13040 isoform X1 [Vigna umbellata]XP_047168833.1 ethylene-responsive transcription factor-like protein At4g13040 isoform X1 [Vigna umbellata]